MWLGRPRERDVAADGTMSLAGHLRELRSRLVKALLAIGIATIVAFVFYEPVLDLLTQPYYAIEDDLTRKGIDTTLVITGVGGALQFQLKIAVVVGILAASPVWLWELWSFVLPALHRHERRWALLLAGTGAPLFLAGATLAYFVLPKAFLVLIGFVPEGFENLVSGAEYYDFVVRMMLVFGVAAEIPLVVILLNRLGVVSGRQLAQARPWTILGIFVFSAVATPSTDPITMLFLAFPMTILYGFAEVIARITDRRKRAAEPEWDDDELSAID